METVDEFPNNLDDPDSWFENADMKKQVRHILFAMASSLNESEFKCLMKLWGHIGGSDILDDPSKLKEDLQPGVRMHVLDLFRSINTGDTRAWICEHKAYLNEECPFTS